MIRELLHCIEKEEKENDLKIQIRLRREKINYLVYYQCRSAKSMNIKFIFGILAIALIGTEIGLFYFDSDSGISIVLSSLLSPFLIATIINLLSGTLVISSKIGEVEQELLDICLYLKMYDKLHSNEEYIMNYINDYSKKRKYSFRNKFEKSKALSENYCKSA